MTNFEKYKDQVTDLTFGVTKENKPVHCVDIKSCRGCIFRSTSKTCEESLYEWLKAEYEEPKINLPKDLDVDAKIYVSNDGTAWLPRHFAKFVDGGVRAWTIGRTSWTSTDTRLWKYARLPKEETDG